MNLMKCSTQEDWNQPPYINKWRLWFRMFGFVKIVLLSLRRKNQLVRDCVCEFMFVCFRISNVEKKQKTKFKNNPPWTKGQWWGHVVTHEGLNSLKNFSFKNKRRKKKISLLKFWHCIVLFLYNLKMMSIGKLRTSVESYTGVMRWP